MPSRLFVALCCAVLAACGGGSSDTEEREEVAFQTLTPNSPVDVAEKKTVVIRDAAAWKALWTDGMPNGDEAAVQPTVDFSTRMVLGVYTGGQPNRCYAVAVKRVTRAEGKTRVEWQQTVPSDKVLCTQSFVYPSDLVSVPADPAPVEFVELPPKVLGGS